MKKFFVLLGVLFIMQTLFLIADSAKDTVWKMRTHNVINLEFEPDGNLLLIHGQSNGSDNRRGIIIINTSGDTIKQIYNSEGLEFSEHGGQGMWDAHFSQDGRYLVAFWEYEDVNLSKGMLEIFESETWKSIKKIEVPGDVFSLLGSSVLLSPDNNTIVGTTQDGFYFYNALSGALIKHLQIIVDNKNVMPVYSLYSKDGNHIYFTSSDGKLRFLNTQTFEVDYSYNSGYGNLALSRNGRMIAFKTGLSGKAAQVMNVETKEIIQSIPGFATSVRGITFSPDNQYLAVVFEYAGNLNIYNIQNGDSIYNYTTVPPGFALVGVSISSDQKYIVSTSGNLYLYRFLPTTGVIDNPFSEEIIYPNPATNLVNIRFNLIIPGFTNIIIYDNTGREAKQVFQGYLEVGEQNIKSDIRGLKAGNYFIKVSAPETDISFKLIINK
ncbi:MAG: T9SS type A sorting domain-containing protein [Candidatus Kapabacteria bacterium]|nr:T9SS type A sorting domain-containing protein [Candidatus Kapabacteria bacterium]